MSDKFHYFLPIILIDERENLDLSPPAVKKIMGYTKSQPENRQETISDVAFLSFRLHVARYASVLEAEALTFRRALNAPRGGLWGPGGCQNHPKSDFWARVLFGPRPYTGTVGVTHAHFIMVYHVIQYLSDPSRKLILP